MKKYEENCKDISNGEYKCLRHPLIRQVSLCILPSTVGKERESRSIGQIIEGQEAKYRSKDD